MEPLGLQIEAIAANPRLTAEGQRGELRKLATEALGSFAFVSRVEQQLIQDTRAKAATLQTVAAPATDPLLQELRDQEFRRVSPTQPAERVALFMSACERNDTTVLHAMLTAPLPLISDEVKTRGLQERAQRLYPQEMADLEQAAFNSIIFDHADLKRLR